MNVFVYVQSPLCVFAVMEKFDVVAPSSLLLKSESADILSSDSSTQPKETHLRKCVLGEIHCWILLLCTCNELVRCLLALFITRADPISDFL